MSEGVASTASVASGDALDVALDARSINRTINIVAAALGGEGGGVFTSWIIEVANKNGWRCQTTSLAGVAQRTGATIYYIELFPRIPSNAADPVMSLFPAQGDIDIAVTSEIAEAGRMIERGFISKDRTTLITSTHRVYGITEKIDLGDGTIDAQQLIEVAHKYTKALIQYDMAEVATEHGAVISAVLLGALAGSGTLPFSKDSFEAVIQETGKSVATNLAAFGASFDKAQSRGVETFDPGAALADTAGSSEAFVLPPAQTTQGQDLLQRISNSLPLSSHELVYHGIVKALDYQDFDYATTYVGDVESVCALDSGVDDHQLTRSVARYLALWMCYEDVPRVAQIKTRAIRLDKIRTEVEAGADQIVYVTEFFSPRIEEMCAMLPARLGEYLLNNTAARWFLNFFTGGRKLTTNTVSIYVVLRLMAACRRFRRSSLGYREEHKQIRHWLNALTTAAPSNPGIAMELAECGRIVKGYGETRKRTSGQLTAILNATERNNINEPSMIAGLRTAALADDKGAAFAEAIGET